MNVTGSAAATPGIGPEIPDQFDIVIRSYHEGPLRKYVCALTPAMAHPPAGAALSHDSIAHDSIEAAVAAALLHPVPVVEARFWSGFRIALPISLLLWAALFALGFALWNIG